ncbi:MAG: 2-C-methyl-D-erythritol 2,4-cyclodiphosphate synthase, partial [Planctomycetaceae bacterium]
MTDHSSIRVGLGHDSHRLESGRPFVVGGIAIEHDRGPVGHSDG